MIARQLAAALDAVEPIEDTPNTEFPARITNIQSTACILKEGYKLPLKSIAMALVHMLKHWSSNFAAIIIRAKFGVHATTCTVFETGKLTVVGALSVEHALYAAQMYRRVLERVPAVYYNPGRIITDLYGRARFDEFRIGNVVASCKLSYRVNLKRFRDRKQRDARWVPDAFPGCPYLVWVRPREECACINKKTEKEMCGCNVKATIFDTGTFNITGSNNLQDTNRAKYIVKAFTEKYKADEPLPPKNKRYAARRQEIFSASLDETGLRQKKQKREIKGQSLEDLLKVVPFVKREKIEDDVFTHACVTKQIAVVRDLVLINASKYVNKTVQMLQESPDPWRQQIAQTLCKWQSALG